MKIAPTMNEARATEYNDDERGLNCKSGARRRSQYGKSKDENGWPFAFAQLFLVGDLVITFLTSHKSTSFWDGMLIAYCAKPNRESSAERAPNHSITSTDSR